ncbi:MAG: ABC transporter permease subunit [Clostridiales bacterium]|nr:ABC transporter permease subunit [Clostridiales bacterium]
MKKHKREILKDVLVPIGVLVAALVIWQTSAWITSAKVTPVVTFSAILDVLKENVFWRSFGATLLRALIAFAVSFVLAFIFAILAAGSDIVSRIFSPVITALRSVPTMAIVLVFILTVSANTTTILVGMLVLFPTFYAALLPAAKGISKDLIEISLVSGASRLQRVRYVYLPSIGPAAAENGIAGLSLSVKLIVSAEVLAQTARSIGMMMQTARAYLELERLLALTILVVVVCIIIDAVGKAVLSLLF